MENFNLNEQQKAYIEANHKKIPDLIEFTRKVFDDDTLDGRTKQGKAVREYLVNCGYKYNTTKKKKAKRIRLTEEQKEFIETSAQDEMNAFQIACRKIFIGITRARYKRNSYRISRNSKDIQSF